MLQYSAAEFLLQLILVLCNAAILCSVPAAYLQLSCIEPVCVYFLFPVYFRECCLTMIVVSSIACNVLINVLMFTLNKKIFTFLSYAEPSSRLKNCKLKVEPSTTSYICCRLCYTLKNWHDLLMCNTLCIALQMLEVGGSKGVSKLHFSGHEQKLFFFLGLVSILRHAFKMFNMQENAPTRVHNISTSSKISTHIPHQ